MASDTLGKLESSVFAARQRAHLQAGSVYNIWYNKWAGGDTWGENRIRAETRVDVARDSGETLGSRNPEAYFCVFFAHGCCPKGYQCQFLHRIPRAGDRKERSRDCFGRDRWGTLRDDMGGTGSFMRENHTLYVGRIGRSDDLEGMIRRHVQEFGKVEKIKLLPSKGVAFVTFSDRLNAEFAKEALMDQSMDNNEILNIRWATDDPNPRAREEIQKDMDKRAAEKIFEMEDKWQKVHEQQQKEYEAQIELQHQYEESLKALPDQSSQDDSDQANMSSTKRLRLENGTATTPDTQPPLPANSIISLQTLQAIRTIAASAPGLTLNTNSNGNSNSSSSGNKRSASAAAIGLVANYGSDDSDDE